MRGGARAGRGSRVCAASGSGQCVTRAGRTLSTRSSGGRPLAAPRTGVPVATDPRDSRRWSPGSGLRPSPARPVRKPRSDAPPRGIGHAAKARPSGEPAPDGQAVGAPDAGVSPAPVEGSRRADHDPAPPHRGGSDQNHRRTPPDPLGGPGLLPESLDQRSWQEARRCLQEYQNRVNVVRFVWFREVGLHSFSSGA